MMDAVNDGKSHKLKSEIRNQKSETVKAKIQIQIEIENEIEMPNEIMRTKACDLFEWPRL